jgi:hypothetical protein
MDEENPMRNECRDEQGFALILAILSLMLLTFLGLALAATTSTEMQIATNYRWSQQALYNAEAGLEIGRRILQPLTWSTLVPAARPEWVVTCLPKVVAAGEVQTCTPANVAAPTTPAARADHRDYENSACDVRGSGMGFGRVLSDAIPYQNVTTMGAAPNTHSINGAFTLWVARPIRLNAADSGAGTETWIDAADNDTLVLTAEGVAPYIGNSSANTAQAVQVIR